MTAKPRRPLRMKRTIVCLGLALLSSATLARASIVRSLNLEDLTGRADRIFSGRCVEVREVRDDHLGQTVTYTTFEVDRAVKGDVPRTITIRTLGGAQREGRVAAGLASVPRFRPGEEAILFLYAESAAGLTSPVGFGQGAFRILEDKTGREVALGAAGGRTLLRGLSPRALGRLSPAQRGWRDRGDLTPGVLLDLAAALARSQEGGAER